MNNKFILFILLGILATHVIVLFYSDLSTSYYLLYLDVIILMFFIKLLFDKYHRDIFLQKVNKEIQDGLISGNIQNIFYFGKDKEFKSFIDNLNDAIEYLNNKTNNTKLFNSNIAHEIKAPLTLLKAELEYALLYKNNNLDEQIVVMLEKLKNLEDIVDQMLLISNDRVKEINNNMQRVFLSEILLNVLEQKQEVLQLKNIDIVDTIECIGGLHANKLLLQYALSNILDNAIKYSSQNSKIFVRMKQTKSYAYILIKDNGIGINKHELPLIFHPYYRGVEQESIIKGHGLGLSLATWILNLHSAKITIKSKPNKGTLVIIRFNIAS